MHTHAYSCSQKTAMVRSILFTGDCPAARAVTERKLEEHRHQQAAAATVHSTGGAAGAEDTVGGRVNARRSKSSIKKTTGTGIYAASVNPVKRAINEYLARLAEEYIGLPHVPRLYVGLPYPHASAVSNATPSPSPDITIGAVGVTHERGNTWVLALETRDLLTVASLGAVGFRANHVVVPNPNKIEVEAMRGFFFW